MLNTFITQPTTLPPQWSLWFPYDAHSITTFNALAQIKCLSLSIVVWLFCEGLLICSCFRSQMRFSLDTCYVPTLEWTKGSGCSVWQVKWMKTKGQTGRHAVYSIHLSWSQVNKRWGRTGSGLSSLQNSFQVVCSSGYVQGTTNYIGSLVNVSCL